MRAHIIRFLLSFAGTSVVTVLGYVSFIDSVHNPSFMHSLLIAICLPALSIVLRSAAPSETALMLALPADIILWFAVFAIDEAKGYTSSTSPTLRRRVAVSRSHTYDMLEGR